MTTIKAVFKPSRKLKCDNQDIIGEKHVEKMAILLPSLMQTYSLGGLLEAFAQH